MHVYGSLPARSKGKREVCPSPVYLESPLLRANRHLGPGRSSGRDTSEIRYCHTVMRYLPRVERRITQGVSGVGDPQLYPLANGKLEYKAASGTSFWLGGKIPRVVIERLPETNGRPWQTAVFRGLPNSHFRHCDVTMSEVAGFLGGVASELKRNRYGNFFDVHPCVDKLEPCPLNLRTLLCEHRFTFPVVIPRDWQRPAVPRAELSDAHSR